MDVGCDRRGLLRVAECRDADHMLIGLKMRLWRRYSIFYDAETIGEVYPENELMEWVWEAFGEKAGLTMKVAGIGKWHTNRVIIGVRGRCQDESARLTRK